MLTIDNTEILLDSARALAGCPIPDGLGVAVLSGQAGPGMAGCDVSEAQGLKIVKFTEKTQQKINEHLPPIALRTNPVDMGPAWYDLSAIEEIIRAVMHDDNVDGILIFMMFASANVDAVKGIGELLEKWAWQKPLISCILSPPGIWDKQINALVESGSLLNYPTPERAANAMPSLWKYRKRQIS